MTYVVQYTNIYFFGNISLYNIDDCILCFEFLKYLKTLIRYHIDFNVDVKIENNIRYIVCYIEDIKINIKISDNDICDSFLCNMVGIQKENNVSKITDYDFYIFIIRNGFVKSNIHEKEQIFFNETNGYISINNNLSKKNNEKIKFVMGKLSIRTTINIVNSVRLKIAFCLYKYKIHKNKIIFDQTLFCSNKDTCKKNLFMCNKKYKKQEILNYKHTSDTHMIKSFENNIYADNNLYFLSKNRDIYTDNYLFINNVERGLCPCEMNNFMHEFIRINKDGYIVMLEKSLKINYNDVIWPSEFNTYNVFTNNLPLHKTSKYIMKEALESMIIHGNVRII